MWNEESGRGHFDGIAILEEIRGKGMGKALFSSLAYYSKKNGVDKNEISSWIDIKCDYNCSKNYCYFFIKLKNNNKQIVLSDFNHKVG